MYDGFIPESANSVDRKVVGRVPYSLSTFVSQFLQRDVNKAFARITGERVNRGAGYGLEIPCAHQFFGLKPYMYVDKLREVG